MACGTVQGVLGAGNCVGARAEVQEPGGEAEGSRPVTGFQELPEHVDFSLHEADYLPISREMIRSVGRMDVMSSGDLASAGIGEFSMIFAKWARRWGSHSLSS